MRLIDADALMKDIDNEIFNTESRKSYEKMRVRKQPTIEAEPVRHGRWIHDINNLFGCSECLAREVMSSRRSLKDYCPSCGAKMDGDINAAD